MVENKPVPGERVVIIEAEGYHVGAALADRLSAEGKSVTVLTHLGELAPYTHYTLEATHLRKKLYTQGVSTAASMVPTRITPRVCGLTTPTPTPRMRSSSRRTPSFW